MWGGKKAPLRIIEVMRSFGYKAYVLKYMQPVKEIDINDTDSLLEECCDLVFTKGSHIDKIIEDEKNNEHCQQEASVSVQMEDMGDGELRKQLAFSEEAFKEAVKVQEDLKKQLEFSEKAFQDAVKVQEDLKKQLAFSKQAFQDAVKVQNELKSRIYHPRTADVMRALKYFVSKKR